MTQPIETPMWRAACSVHWATTARPLCPSCLDDKAKEAKK